nr:hypothetical protein [uncultured Caulobacter sp.]
MRPRFRRTSFRAFAGDLGYIEVLRDGAIRHENFSKFGQTTDGKIAARY